MKVAENLGKLVEVQKILIFFFVLLFPFFVYAEEPKPIWQQSEGVNVEIGVRDKFGSLKGYNALFVVVSPTGKKYRVEKKIADDNWGYVYFPADFKTTEEPGEYSWKCFVNGKEVTGGKFVFSTIKTFSDQATVLRE